MQLDGDGYGLWENLIGHLLQNNMDICRINVCSNSTLIGWQQFG